ncbi:hypothetical protein PG987_008193 [Apiospora arundinis]
MSDTNQNMEVRNGESKECEVVMGSPAYDGRVALYVIKADQTSWINYMKPLILAAELKDQDPETGEEVIVFESTACLQYLADRWDKDGYWTGRTARERGAVMSWTEYQTAGIGATAKYWLYFLKGYPTRAESVQLPRTIKKLHDNVVKQWEILEKRLSQPGQDYIALSDRPTLADLSYFPYGMPWMFKFLDVEMSNWPNIVQWATRLAARPAVREILEMAPKIGH